MTVGCELGAIGSAALAQSIQRATLPVSRLSSATAEEFQRLTHALVPLRLAITVYGYALGIKRLRLRSNDCTILSALVSRTIALSERLSATSRRSPFGPCKTA